VEYSGGIVSNWRRWSPALGDLNGDGAVSLSDVAQLTGCLDGPGAGLGAGCECADADADGDVDLADTAVFQTRFAGS
ncbi:MAG TPA: dockerin type I domain-containing protein, partial [Phycisphaerae bacterium]